MKDRMFQFLRHCFKSYNVHDIIESSELKNKIISSESDFHKNLLSGYGYNVNYIIRIMRENNFIRAYSYHKYIFTKDIIWLRDDYTFPRKEGKNGNLSH